MDRHTRWADLSSAPLVGRGRAAYDDEARISAFRELVYRLRTLAGMSQGEYADQLGVDPATIARTEDGAVDPGR